MMVAPQATRHAMVRVVSSLLLLLQFTLPVIASGEFGPVALRPTSGCSNPIVRKEWRTLSATSRKSYIGAVKCLMQQSALTPLTDLPGVANRYEDFLGTHIAQALDIHFVGKFYPWHRLMLAIYEKTIQNCGYSGALPYWDWTLDSGTPAQFTSSPIFNTVTGFGGNGPFVPGNFSNPAPGLFVGPPWDIPDRTGGGCIPDGPFKNLNTGLGPGPNIQNVPHCVRRDFAPATFASMSNSAGVTDGLNMPDYGSFSQLTEFTVHAGGHQGIGGLYGAMSDQWASPSDPIFYLHHANVDRLWWSWQSRNLAKRLTDISGPLLQFDYGNQRGGNATLDTEIRVGQSVNITLAIRDVMNIKGNTLCYRYDTLY